jgi:hypothetical protein
MGVAREEKQGPNRVKKMEEKLDTAGLLRDEPLL